MNKMVDTGIPWLGSINEKFQIKKLKYIADILDQFRKPITADKRNQNAEILYDYYGASGAIDKIDGYTIDDHVMLIGEDGANLRMRNLPLMYEVNGKAWINNHAHILKPKNGTDFYYLFYALESIDINPYVTGSAQPKLNQENLKEIVIPFPPFDEQKKIADFLDEKCGEIDSIRADVQRQIELLNDYKKSVITEAVTKGLNPKAKLKDSGIEWVRKIPEKWNVIRLKHASWLKGRIGWQGLRSEEFMDEGPYLITGTDFKDGHINWETCVHISEQRFNQDKAIQIKEDDLLITKDGTIGKLAIVKNCPEKVSLNSGVFIIRNNGKYKYIDKYMYYVLQSEEFTLWFDLSNAGNSTIKHLNQEGFYNFAFAYPPLSEQKEIADYLDEKCSEIDAVVADKQKQLETLDEYKKSLIFEYVTGKKEVLA